LFDQLSFSDNTEMPDAMDLIFQTALECGKSGAVSIIVRFLLIVSFFCDNY
jgi:hypothetical protein